MTKMRITLTNKLLVLVCTFLSFNTLAEITFPASSFQNLDYGLYWFGYVDAQKAEPGQANLYYENHKPTVIFIHGWQADTVTEQYRSTLDTRSSGGPDMDLSQFWLDQGYNVGILYWNQFADEDEVKDAESKIWSATANQGMRWKSLDGNYQTGPSQTVAELLFKSIRDNMDDFDNAHLRLAGHSLGNQLALLVGQKLNDAVDAGLNANLRPDRIALLDPFYSKDAKSYLDGDWTGERARDIADDLKDAGVIIEAVRSSATGSSGIAGDTNTDLMNKTAFTELRPWNFSFYQLAEKHSAAITWYFWSLAFDPPQLRRNQGDAPSAATSDERTEYLMNANQGAWQKNGIWSATPADDEFNVTSRL